MKVYIGEIMNGEIEKEYNRLGNKEKLSNKELNNFIGLKILSEK